MSKKFFSFVVVLILLSVSLVKSAYAIENPLTKPNNKFGIHILFPTEVQNAAKLINSNGGDWGYVTIPIQANDRDLKKWQQFMNNCKRYHVIPILRLATVSDLDDTTVWKKPYLTDVIDFATFLNKLTWPTQNRYVIIFNEVNRGNEWGGAVSPSEYANILSFAVTVFKSKSPDFFVISAGLDNAAPNQGNNFMNEYEYMREMNDAVPAIFYQVDGMASHSYPNPGFAQSPNSDSLMGVGSFIHERDLAKDLTGKTLPVFITETGWSGDVVTDSQKSKYYQDTFANVWNDPGIIAITPFILEARTAPFQRFSFLTATGTATAQYQTLTALPKIKGLPTLPKVLAAQTVRVTRLRGNPVPVTASGFSFSNVVQKIISVL